MTMLCNACAHAFREESPRPLFAPLAPFGGGALRCPRCGLEIRETPDLKRLFKKFSKRKTPVARR